MTISVAPRTMLLLVDSVPEGLPGKGSGITIRFLQKKPPFPERLAAVAVEAMETI